MPIRVSLVEDQLPTQRRFAALLEGPDVRVTSVHATAEDALQTLPIDDIDLALVDIVLPGMSGIDLTRELKERRPNLPVLMLSAFEDTEKIFGSFAAGADGYLLKTDSSQTLHTRIREALNGGCPLSASVARKVIQHFRQHGAAHAELAQLTERELAVLREVAKGKTYKEVGDALNISTETVRTHIRNIKAKLRVSTRGQAVAKFLTR